MADPIHVFVDSNVWLAFFAYTSDDVEQLKKIIALVQKNKLKLYIPQQVADEFYRNRENKLDEALRLFAKGDFTKNVPRCMLDYPEAKKYREVLAEFQNAKDALITRAKAEAEQKELAADKLFADILAATPAIPADAATLGLAGQRRLTGNPPGKPSSVGDQLNWEVLLKEVPDGTDLHVVSKDGDFESELIPGRANQFLIDEWARRKNGELTLHSELRPFLNAKFPGIKLAVDIEKEEAISRLISAGNFAATHYAVSQLTPLLEHVTWAEADKLIDAALNNTQVRWIGTDEDVKTLYNRLIQNYADKIDDDRKNELTLVLSPPKVDESDFADWDIEAPF